MVIPTDDELRSYYSVWFEENFCMKTAKPAPAVIAFAQAVLQRYGRTDEAGDA